MRGVWRVRGIVEDTNEVGITLKNITMMQVIGGRASNIGVLQLTFLNQTHTLITPIILKLIFIIRGSMAGRLVVSRTEE